MLYVIRCVHCTTNFLFMSGKKKHASLLYRIYPFLNEKFDVSDLIEYITQLWYNKSI